MVEILYQAEDLIKKIQNDEIHIQLNPVFAMYSIDDVKEDILLQLNQVIERNKWNDTRPSNSYTNLLRKELATGVYEDSKGLLCHNFNPLKMHNPYLAQEVCLTLENDTIDFLIGRAFDRDGHTGYEYVVPDMDGPFQPITWEIDVPSKHILFVNFFRTSNPDNPDKYERHYSINGGLGRKNTAMYYASHNNVGYGQMDNTSIAIYSNDSEILIINPYVVDTIEEYEWEDEDADTPRIYTDAETKEYREAQALVEYMVNNSMVHRGDICLEMWRYECADYEQVKEEIPTIDQDMVGISL